MKRYLLLFFIYLSLALVLSAKNHIYIVPPIMISLFFIDKKVFRILTKWKFLLFLSILAFGVPMFIGDKDGLFRGIPYSSEVFLTSFLMVERSIIILLSLKMFTNHIPMDHMSNGLQKIRLKKFSQVFSISLQTLPKVKDLTSNTYKKFKQRTYKKNILSDIFDFMVQLIVNILKFADTYYLEKRDKKDLNEE